MAISLYEATIPTYRQILGAGLGWLDKAEAFCGERGLLPGDILQKRVAEDMFPFAYQVKSMAVHSIGAIEGIRRGSFSPDRSPPPDSFPALKERLEETLAALALVTPEEMEDFEGEPMLFTMGDLRVNFTRGTFLLTFSQPNFFFHATTAYGILRGAGVPLGKRDFLGKLRRVE